MRLTLTTLTNIVSMTVKLKQGISLTHDLVPGLLLFVRKTVNPLSESQSDKPRVVGNETTCRSQRLQPMSVARRLIAAAASAATTRSKIVDIKNLSSGQIVNYFA